MAAWLSLGLLTGALLGAPRSGRITPRLEEAPAHGAERLLHGLRIDPGREPAEVLEVLPGIGPSLAEAIVTAREQRPFCSLEDLLRVPGIGRATLQRIRRQLEIGPQRGSGPRDACASLSSPRGRLDQAPGELPRAIRTRFSPRP